MSSRVCWIKRRMQHILPLMCRKMTALYFPPAVVWHASLLCFSSLCYFSCIIKRSAARSFIVSVLKKKNNKPSHHRPPPGLESAVDGVGARRMCGISPVPSYRSEAAALFGHERARGNGARQHTHGVKRVCFGQITAKSNICLALPRRSVSVL